MTNFEMYETVLYELRKDKKGSITLEEFEGILKFRSLWMFKQLLPVDGATKRNEEALIGFKVEGESQSASSIITPTNTMAHFISGSTIDGAEFDLVTSGEYRKRETNAITLASAINPVCLLHNASGVLKLKLYPVAAASVPSLIDYYKYPTEPYLDYYVDANLEYQYLTEGQAAYTLLTSEVARDGSTAGSEVTSATAEIEWKDAEKVMLIEYILTDLGVILKDPEVTQQAMMERQTSLIK